MLSSLKKNLLKVVCALWALINALFWLSLRVNWAGISKFLGADKNPSFFVMESPLLVCILMWAIFGISLVLMLRPNKGKLPFFILLGVNLAMTAACIAVIIFGAKDYLQFILPKFGRSLLVTAGIIAIALLLFFPTPKGKKATAVKCAVLALVLLASVFFGYGISFGNRFTYEPVVYAVEDEYQIVFSTSAKSIVWVEIGGEKFYDLYAGSMRSEDLVHKVTVPQQLLDSAKGYSIHAKQMIYRGPFGGYTGSEISSSYAFRPVNSSDGLVYYSMSDVHSALEGAVATASAVQDMDFLVIIGDSVSMVDREVDAQFANKLAFAVTKGEFPVIYARGNHEIKGIYSEELYKYVGSKNGSFFYEFTLSDVYGVVLDLGEDHDDDWWEYYGTAQFVEYQKEQTAMLEKAVTENHSEGFNYTLAVSHIPINFVNYRHNHETVKAEWTVLLNQLRPDLMVTGHQHDLYPFFFDTITHNADHQLVYNPAFKSGTYSGYVTDFKFNSFIVGKRGSTQTDEPSFSNKTEHIGLVTRVDLNSGSQTSSYINSFGNKVPVFNPFVAGDAQTDFVTELLN